MEVQKKNEISNQNIGILIGICILISYYLFCILNLNIPSNKAFYLSFSLPSDTRYNNLILNFDTYLSDPKIVFSWAQIHLEHYIESLLGFNNLWFIIPFYKIITFLILFIGFHYAYASDKSFAILLSISIALLICSDFQPFFDRYPRPSNTNIPFSIIFVGNILIFENKTLGKIFLFIFGASYGLIIFSNPWAFCFLLPMTVFASKLQIFKVFNIYSIAGFVFLLTPQALSIVSAITEGSLHSEYIGLKDIEKPTLFILDYYKSFFDKRILFFAALLCTSALLLTQLRTLKMLFLTCLLAPLPFILFGKTVQSYHLIIIAKDMMVYLILYDLILFLKMRNLLFLGIEIKRTDIMLTVTLILLTFFSLVVDNNSWMSRAKNIFNNYGKIFNQVSLLPKHCILITNDEVMQSYWAGVEGAKYFPKDGFFRSDAPSIAVTEAAFAIHLLKKHFPLNERDIKNMLQNATHNYFVTTRSTVAPSMQQKEAVLARRKDVNSMGHWIFFAPKDIINSMIDINYTLQNNYNNKLILIFNHSNNESLQSHSGEQLEIINLCLP